MIASTFAALRARNEGALILFVTAGDPSLEALPGILGALEEGGADLVEIGIPFSDPIADGPIIQASSQRALDRGVTPDQILDILADHPPLAPRILMGYVNPAMAMGYANFARAAHLAGACGVILSDLTPDEAADWLPVAHAHELDPIFLVAPTSTDARIRLACESGRGFIYAVSRTGVTGAGLEAGIELAEFVGRVRNCTDLPVCVGFGISEPDDVEAVCRVADGAIVGSALVTRIAETWNDGLGRESLVQWVRRLKAATRR